MTEYLPRKHKLAQWNDHTFLNYGYLRDTNSSPQMLQSIKNSLYNLLHSWRREWVVSRWTSCTFWAPRRRSTSSSTASTRPCGQQDPPSNLRPGLWASGPGRGRRFRPATSWSRSYPRTTAGYVPLPLWHRFKAHLLSESLCRSQAFGLKM